ncbi:hypothetical protein PM8797T_17162 [Gimesia maris DSM 8797]|nr:hypothetical protein PM8797T_17162 [Gimesia maris DSM 8797]
MKVKVNENYKHRFLFTKDIEKHLLNGRLTNSGMTEVASLR